MAGDNREERQARSLALERAYVHDVYDRIAHHFADTRYRPWPRVRQFLEELEPGSIVADIGKLLSLFSSSSFVPRRHLSNVCSTEFSSTHPSSHICVMSVF